MKRSMAFRKGHVGELVPEAVDRTRQFEIAVCQEPRYDAPTLCYL
jgi:hypothetical protein